MKIYSYHPQTGIYLGESEADESPLEPGVFLIPAYATDTAPPPLAAKEVAVFNAGAWATEADYRGETWYDTATQAAVSIDAIGQPPAHLTELKPASAFETWNGSAWVADVAAAQAAQVAALYASYAAAIAQPVAYTSAGGVAQTYQADDTSMTYVNRMLSAYDGAKATPAGFYWVAADNAKVPFTYADLQGLAAAMGAQGWVAFQKMQTLKAQVKAATTVAAVTAVTW